MTELLNSQKSSLAVYKAYSNPLLARIVNLRYNNLANISENFLNSHEQFRIYSNCMIIFAQWEK